jgi:hypothetical protein
MSGQVPTPGGILIVDGVPGDDPDVFILGEWTTPAEETADGAQLAGWLAVLNPDRSARSCEVMAADLMAAEDEQSSD